MSKQTKEKPSPEPWSRPPYDKVVHYALRALHQGEASEHQQKLVLDWILKKATVMNGQSFFKGDPMVTAFLEGRRSVGLQIWDYVSELPETTRGDM